MRCSGVVLFCNKAVSVSRTRLAQRCGVEVWQSTLSQRQKIFVVAVQLQI
jgi:hypothetical protein